MSRGYYQVSSEIDNFGREMLALSKCLRSCSAQYSLIRDKGDTYVTSKNWRNR